MAFKTAKTILTYSKKDIEAGLWCKGSLAKFGTDSGTDITEEDLEDDYSKPVDGEDFGPVTLLDKPMGCALGLVSMYAGLGEKTTVIDVEGKKHKFFLPRYPRFADGEGIKKALSALYDAIPVKDRRYNPATAHESPTEDTVIESIHYYNDQNTMGAKRATKWFEKALASL